MIVIRDGLLCCWSILGDLGAVSRVAIVRKGGTKVFSYGQKSPWVLTLTELFPKFKWMPAPDWAQKMLCIIEPNRRKVSAEFFSWVRTRRLFVRSFTKLVRARETFIFYFPNQKRKNYRSRKNVWDPISRSNSIFPENILFLCIGNLRCGGDEKVK